MKTKRITAIAVVAGLLLLAGVAYATTLTPRGITPAGLVLTPVPATATEFDFENDGHQAIWFSNGSDSTLNYTVTIPGSVAGYALEDIVGTVISHTELYVGPFNPTYANNASGKVDFTVDITDSVMLAVIELR